MPNCRCSSAGSTTKVGSRRQTGQGTKKEEFLLPIELALLNEQHDVDAEEVARAVFQVLAKHVTSGAIEHRKSVLPMSCGRCSLDVNTVQAGIPNSDSPQSHSLTPWSNSDCTQRSTGR